VWGLLQLAGGCGLHPGTMPPDRRIHASPVELRCERMADSVLHVTLRNHTGQGAIHDPGSFQWAIRQ
jgi:hypothetical protein